MVVGNKVAVKNEVVMAVSVEDKKRKFLTGIDVCTICSLRIINGNNAITKIFGEYEVNDSEVKPGSHCFSCLGILEDSTLCAVAKGIAENMATLKYDSPTFQLGVTIPQCLILHQTSIITYLAENEHPCTNKNLPAIKTTVKFFLNKLIEKFSKKTFHSHSDLLIKLDFIFPDSALEISKLDFLLAPTKKRKLADESPPGTKTLLDNNPYKADSIAKVVKGLEECDVKKYTIYPPKPLAETCMFTISMHHSPLFFGGRYMKHSRIGGLLSHIRRGEAAMEFISEKLIFHTQGTSIKLHSIGVEDPDVKILGNGKPFSAEIIDPKTVAITSEQMAKILVDINCSDQVTVHDLQLVNKAGFELLKKGGDSKVKTYSAKLWCPEPISDESIEKLNAMTDIELQQNSPIRVLHRYPATTMTKKIHEVELRRSDEKGHYDLNLKVQAGTYVKEFVHGDFGRTEPSLRTILGVPIDIVELDFISVNLNWPPELQYKSDVKSKVE